MEEIQAEYNVDGDGTLRRTWQLDQEKENSSLLNTPEPEMEDSPFNFPVTVPESFDHIPPVPDFPPEDIFTDGSEPRHRLIDVEEQRETNVRRRRREIPSRDLLWWSVQSLFGEDKVGII